jgi:hypothetical protein
MLKAFIGHFLENISIVLVQRVAFSVFCFLFIVRPFCYKIAKICTYTGGMG